MGLVTKNRDKPGAKFSPLQSERFCGIIRAKGERCGMALPLKIDDLVHQRKVEWARIEYKKNWNPEKVLHRVGPDRRGRWEVIRKE